MTELPASPLSALTLDEATRPTAPPIAAATDDDRRRGRQLAAIHRAYLADLAQIDLVLRRIEAGDAPPESLARIVLSLDMAENLRAFGTLCGQECRVLRFHHDIEEHTMFPRLDAAGDAGLGAVIRRLRDEHAVIHDLLGRLERAAIALVDAPTDDNLTEAAAIFRHLHEVVRSHFGYEETALEEAIGVHLGGI